METASDPVRSLSEALGWLADEKDLHDVLNLGNAQLLHVGHVLEVLVARPEPGGATEVVDRDRVVARLRKALRQFGVERVQAPDVGQDHDAGRVCFG